MNPSTNHDTGPDTVFTDVCRYPQITAHHRRTDTHVDLDVEVGHSPGDGYYLDLGPLRFNETDAARLFAVLADWADFVSKAMEVKK